MGEIGRVIDLVLTDLGEVDTVDQRPEVAERSRIWRIEKQSRVGDDRGKGVASAAIFDALTRHAPADAVIAVDVGNNAYSFGRYFSVSNKLY